MNDDRCPITLWPGVALGVTGAVWWAGLLLLLPASGCATYHSVPLDEATHAARAAPDVEALRVAVSDIEHPYLQPQPLDFADGLSPEEAALVAVAANPGLRATRTRRGVTRAQLVAAGLLPQPQLSAGAAFLINAPPEEVTELSAGLSLDLRSLFTRGAEKKSARATRRSVDMSVAWQEWQVAQRARLQAYRAAFLRHETALARAREHALARERDALRKAAGRHLATAVDRAAAEKSYRAARSTRLGLALQRDSTRRGLRRVLGLPVGAGDSLQLQRGVVSVERAALREAGAPPSPLDAPADTLAAPLPAPDTTTAPFPALPLQSALLRGLAHRRLDLAALRLGYRSQEQAVRLAVLRQFPTISVGVNGTRDTGGFLTLGPAVSLGLPFFGHARGRIAKARATRAKLRAEYTARRHAARAQVAQLLGQIRDARRKLRNATVAARVQRDLVRRYGQALRLGDADVLTYYDARTTRIDKALSVLQLRQRLVELGIALEIASGRYLPSLLPTSSHP